MQQRQLRGARGPQYLHGLFYFPNVDIPVDRIKAGLSPPGAEGKAGW